MDKKRLHQRLMKPLTKIEVQQLAALIGSSSYPAEDLLLACLHPQKAVAFRAAWILECMEEKYPDRFVPIQRAFFDQLPLQKNESCQRHFSKIIMRICSPKAIPLRKAWFCTLTLHMKEQLIEVLFEWLIQSSTPVAVKVNCMDVLCDLAPLFPWVKEELIAQITFDMKNGSAAMQSRGNKLLKRLAH